MVNLENPKIAVVGAGAWGTALAFVLASKGYAVTIWAREEEVCATINAEHENTVFLPGAKLPENIGATSDLAKAVGGMNLIVSVVPSQFLRRVVKDMKPHLSPDAVIVSASKGIETDTLSLMSDVFQEELPREMHGSLCFVSGPSFAKETVQKMPTNVTLACENGRVAREVQAVFHQPWFRIYTSYDVVGVELGGALKNVVALAAGALEGMGMGYNTQCAMITRGLAEISRLGVRMGANPLTFAGLSGMGDLVLTCMGSLSRNRTVGVRVGKGEKVADILGGMKQVAEGVETARSTWQLAQREGVDMPIAEQVYRVLHEGKDVKVALQDLLARDLKSELE